MKKLKWHHKKNGATSEVVGHLSERFKEWRKKKGKNPAILTAYGRRSNLNNKRNIFVKPKLYREDREVPHQKKRTKTAISRKKIENIFIHSLN